MSDSAAHWDAVFARTAPDQVSWYEDEPTMSLHMVRAAASSAVDAIVDIGAGRSRLVDRLLQEGWTDITVLDVSDQALSIVRARLGEEAADVTFVVTDLLVWEPGRTFKIWHDRAVFHFLTSPRDRASYVRTAARAVRSGGAMVLGVFAQDGPTQCSGLPTARYDADDLESVFAEHFVLETFERETHLTPRGAAQPLTWVVLRRR